SACALAAMLEFTEGYENARVSALKSLANRLRRMPPSMPVSQSPCTYTTSVLTAQRLQTQFGNHGAIRAGRYRVEGLGIGSPTVLHMFRFAESYRHAILQPQRKTMFEIHLHARRVHL